MEPISGVWFCFREAFELLVNPIGPLIQFETLGILGILCYIYLHFKQS